MRKEKKNKSEMLNRTDIEKITSGIPIYNLNIKYQEEFEICATLATIGQPNSQLDWHKPQH